ncbi:hypothetical protein TTRE_0000137101 [Trichuris trichiura]|uniref:Uncharacterized protein n=1 Tax=Trichuris trichiura TaxID=36087 RepID=A0A077Z096_TRITR|nr:hypothetical protein TTRE_0000137101 [Trichuris trichiura]
MESPLVLLLLWHICFATALYPYPLYGEYVFEDADNFMRRYEQLCGDDEPDICVARLFANYNPKADDGKFIFS